MKPFLPQIVRVALGCLMAMGFFPLPAQADPPPPTIAALNSVQLRVLLRTPAGQPVPGIAVDLAPTAPEFGGPTAGTPAQRSQTDATGAVLFDRLEGAIWRVAFTGNYAGQPLQPVADQAQPPYGTTQGDGFVVQTSLQEENDAPAPIVGVPAPTVETLSFVLLPTGGGWTPAIDLAPPTDLPQPLSLLTQAATRTMFHTPPQLSSGEPPAAESLGADEHKGNADGGFAGLWLLPVLAAGAALWRVWRVRCMGKHRAPRRGIGTHAKSDRGHA